MSGDKLVHNGHQYTPANLELLPGLTPEEVSTRVIGDDITFFTGNSPFSNHHRCEFYIDGQIYTSVEQFFMLKKACAAGDKYIQKKIMETNDPIKQDLGKKILNHNEKSWKGHSEKVMLEGVHAKFTQSRPLAEKPMSTNGKGLFEMNKHDFYRGTGCSLFGEGSTDRRQWKGSNKLGKILEQVRCELLYEHLNKSANATQR